MSNTKNSICAPNAAFADKIGAATGLESFTIDIVDSDLWDTPETIDSSCVDSDALFYAQFECIVGEADLNEKYN